MCSGPVSGDKHQRRSVENADEVAESAAERRYRRRASAIARMICSAASSRGERPPTSTGCRPKSCQSASPTSAQRSGHPVLLRLARRHDDRRHRPIERREELPLPRTLVGPRAEVPLDRLVRHAERGEELEILILDVLRLVRRNAVRREQPVRVARARAIEAQLHGRARERRDDPRLEVDLQRRAPDRSRVPRARGGRRRTRASRARGRR